MQNSQFMRAILEADERAKITHFGLQKGLLLHENDKDHDKDHGWHNNNGTGPGNTMGHSIEV